MTLKNFAYATVAASLVLLGCGDDSATDGTTTGTGNTGTGNTGGLGGSGGGDTGGTGGGGGGDIGPPPALGDQIDRMGRPAINTALNTTFLTEVPAPVTPAEREAAQDEYNQNDNPTQWVEAYLPTMTTQLAILDGVNQNCEDNLITSCGDDTVANDTCYATLAGALATDMLWVNTEGTSSAIYLAVEANALGVVPNEDVGGRRPVDDVIQTSYSVLGLGAVTGLDDGIPVEAATQAAYEAGFPFFAEPSAE